MHLFGASPSTMILFRRRFHAPLSQTCTAGICARSCKSRREMRPRKLDETLSRHGRSARRVAFLSPRAMFGKYCSPLDYLYARLNSSKRTKSISRILGGLHSSRVGEEYPKGRRGNNTPLLRDVRPMIYQKPPFMRRFLLYKVALCSFSFVWE